MPAAEPATAAAELHLPVRVPVARADHLPDRQLHGPRARHIPPHGPPVLLFGAPPAPPFRPLKRQRALSLNRRRFSRIVSPFLCFCLSPLPPLFCCPNSCACRQRSAHGQLQPLRRSSSPSRARASWPSSRATLRASPAPSEHLCGETCLRKQSELGLLRKLSEHAV